MERSEVVNIECTLLYTTSSASAEIVWHDGATPDPIGCWKLRMNHEFVKGKKKKRRVRFSTGILRQICWLLFFVNTVFTNERCLSFVPKIFDLGMRLNNTQKHSEYSVKIIRKQENAV